MRFLEVDHCLNGVLRKILKLVRGGLTVGRTLLFNFEMHVITQQ